MVWGEEVCEGIDEQGNGALSLLIIQELGPFPLVLPKRKETPRLGSEITNLDHQDSRGHLQPLKIAYTYTATAHDEP